MRKICVAIAIVFSLLGCDGKLKDSNIAGQARNIEPTSNASQKHQKNDMGQVSLIARRASNAEDRVWFPGLIHNTNSLMDCCVHGAQTDLKSVANRTTRLRVRFLSFPHFNIKRTGINKDGKIKKFYLKNWIVGWKKASNKYPAKYNGCTVRFERTRSGSIPV